MLILPTRAPYENNVYRIAYATREHSFVTVKKNTVCICNFAARGGAESYIDRPAYNSKFPFTQTSRRKKNLQKQTCTRIRVRKKRANARTASGRSQRRPFYASVRWVRTLIIAKIIKITNKYVSDAALEPSIRNFWALLRFSSVTSFVPIFFRQQSVGIFLSPSASTKNGSHRSSNVAFSDIVMLHTNESVTNIASAGEKNICSSEKMTQAGDGNVWQVGANVHTKIVN